MVPSDTLSDSTRSRSKRTAQLPPHLPSEKANLEGVLTNLAGISENLPMMNPADLQPPEEDLTAGSFL